ncbi:MAG: pentachlorophenol monooxygenase [Acidobacteria bacterium ACB1]|nr:6-methylpretetramide 4-monooxygenase [Pyrinomonadaceae bacterium]MCE7961433.1 pentachlorophenol monooxygenase [Acidobacteria bacterium ACB1]RIJ94517.1 MAG: pentachlorophenol monooxygenase [Acidobacteriota bacterium]
MIETDVLIVGAGPTGLALAVQLVRYGVDFLIIDTKETTTPFSRAIGVQARTLEIYDQIGLADKLVSLGHRAEKAKFLKGGAVLGEANLSELGVGQSPYPFVLLVEQGLHEELLYNHLKGNGHDVLWRHELLSLADDGEAVAADVRGPDGTVFPVKTRYIVACDGAKSSVRHKLGLTFEGDTVERLFYVADIELEWPHGHDALQVNLGENTLTAFFPLKGENRWRIVGTFPKGHNKDEAAVPYEEIEEQIEHDMGVKLDIKKVNWFSVYNVHSRAVNAFSKGRCFVAGDAAHIHTPAGAQGMNTGIQDGYNLAWKLALVLNSCADEKLLATYNEERLVNARNLLRTTDRFFEFAASEEWLISFLRNNIFPYVFDTALKFDFVKNELFATVSQTGISYSDASLSAESGKFAVKAGDRMPWFELDGTSVYDEIKEPRFHLLVFGADEGAWKKMSDELGAKWQDEIILRSLPLADEVKRAFGNEGPFLALLRPDNYIGYLSDDLSAKTLKEYLERYCSRSGRPAV